jgi:L-galactose dehydrogenase
MSETTRQCVEATVQKLDYILNALGQTGVPSEPRPFTTHGEKWIMSMNYRVLGKTGIEVSVLGFGASPLGGVFGAVDEQQGVRAVHTAVDLGVNFIDVAPYYGLTKAEAVLGKALKEIPRDKYYLSTKVGRYGAEEFDYSAARVIASVDESLARLNVEYIDVIHCHDIEFGNLDLIIEETIPALRRLQATGKVRHIGISGLPLPVFQYMADRVTLDVVLSYCHYTLYDTSLANLLPYLKDKALGVINASPLGMGLLTGHDLPLWHPAPAALKAACAEAAQFCKSRGANLAQLALQFSVANPDVATTLIGIASPEQIVQNAEWISQPLDQELLAEVQHILSPVLNMTWPSGRPENDSLMLNI